MSPIIGHVFRLSRGINLALTVDVAPGCVPFGDTSQLRPLPLPHPQALPLPHSQSPFVSSAFGLTLFVEFAMGQ